MTLRSESGPVVFSCCATVEALESLFRGVLRSVYTISLLMRQVEAANTCLEDIFVYNGMKVFHWPVAVKKSIEIVEVGPRDGLQSEPELLPTAVKVEFIKRAVSAGIRRLEVASFVHPKRVPQMADAEAIVAALPRDEDVVYIGLIMNQKGFERAAATGVHEVGFVVVATDTFNRRNQSVSTGESIKVWHEIAIAAHERGIRPTVTIGAAFGCPFEGEVPTSKVIDIAVQLAEARPKEIALADSIGVGVPQQVIELVSGIRAALPELPVRCHFHNTRNTGLANAFTAVQAGVSSLDASIGGIGGCPFAPAATGNIPTEDLLYMLDRSGIETGVSVEKTIEASNWLRDQLGRAVPALLPKAGVFPAAAVQH